MTIDFFWQGVSGRYGQWKDGLWAAMQEIEKQGHDVAYLEPGIDESRWNADIVLYWEAPCTLNGKDRANYEAVLDIKKPKALLFAGGAVRADICYGFDLYFVESKLNEEEFEQLGLPWKRAFGVNTQIFKPEKQPKVFDGYMQATYAAWKRHKLFAEALGFKGVASGRKQDHEKFCYEECEKNGVLTLEELPAQVVASLINASHTVVNTAEFWGGGQRCTLEAMACGVPVIVMEDAPKNREYVEESGAGVVCKPEVRSIQDAVGYAMNTPGIGARGCEYVLSRYTEKHYAEALLDGMREVLNNRLHT